MKDINYKNIKRINSLSDQNLQKFDLGKRVNQFSGYQAGESLDTTQFNSTPSQSFQPLADSIRSTIAPTAITGATNFLTQAATTALNVPSIASAFGIKSAGTAASTAASAGSTAGSTAAEAAGAAAGTTSSAIGALGALAPVMAIGGLAQGGIGLANAISSFNDSVVSSSDALNSMGKSTQTKYGEAYTTYTGLDRQSIEDVVDQANKAGKTNLTMSGATTGGSAGALIGLAGGPIGSLIGFGIGSLIGAIGSWFGGESAAEKRRKRIERMLDNVEYATTNYNTNEESEAASRGMRRLFGEQHYEADKGKDVYTNFGEPGRIKMVHTSKGIEPGVELGVAGGKESIVDFGNNTASVINEGKKRVDNVSVGTPIDENVSKEDWDNNVFIAGNVTNPYTGNTIAEDAEPYARNVEKINKQNPMTSLGKKTKEINLRNQMEQLKQLSDIQSAVKDVESYFANCGKAPKYNDGKIGEYAMAILPHIAQFGYLAADNTDYTPRSYNPYVASDYDKYVNNIRSRRLDPSQAIKNIEKASLQNRYATTHQGGLSAGQIAALSSMSNLAAASAKNNTYTDYAQKNITLANEADKLGMQANLTEAGRRQQANTNWYEWLMRSGSTAYNLKQAKRKAIYDQLGSIGKDVLAMLQYNQARALQNKKIKLFDKALDPNVLNQLNNLFR